MSNTLAPAWAASAMGIDIQGDEDLSDGIHFRLVYSPILGFPLHPVPVFRTFANSLNDIDIDWFDARGKALSLGGLDVSPDNPITGYLNLDIATQRGLWLRIEVSPGSDVVVEIVGNTTTEQVVVASRDKPPFAFGGSHLNQVRVRGNGTVTDWTVVTQWSLEHEPEPIHLLGLPRPADIVAPFYVGIRDADDRAKQRILSVEPQRFGRHEEFLHLAEPLTATDELQRAQVVAHNRLHSLIERAIDPPANLPPHMVSLKEVNGDQLFRVNPYVQLVTAATDPAIARWLGFMASDSPPLVNPDREAYVAYIVWAVHKQAGWLGQNSFQHAQNRLPAPADPAKPDDDTIASTVMKALADAGRDGDLRELLRNLPAGWEWRSVLLPFVVARNSPPDVLSPQFAGTPRPMGWTPGMPRTVGWTPGTHGNTATFGASIPVQPKPASAFALSRDGVGTVSLNPIYEVGRARLLKRAAPIVIGRSRDVVACELIDRLIPAADAGSAVWTLAEMDAFGRWSEWVNAPVPAIERPRPPAPAIQVRYVSPPPAAAVGSAPLSGTFEIVVEVPDERGLPPGGQSIESIDLNTSWGAFNRNVDPGTVPTITIPGPPLLPAASLPTNLAAKFVDINSRRSPSSAPVGRLIADPRPPAQVVIQRTLNLTGRRDANGLAHVELNWPKQPGQAGYRIFFASEAALRAALDRPGLPAGNRARANALIAALAAARSRADRAGLFIDQKDLFSRDCFELLTSEPVPTARFAHALSGSLSDVVFYRVVAVGSQGMECDFASSGVAAVGVPDDRRPAAPVLAPVANNAGVFLTVPPGPEPVAEFRIRRTRIGLIDARSLRIVASGAVPAAAAGNPQTVEWLDSEQPRFVRVTYVAELRYAREVGTDRDREWSLPSNPITWVHIPPSAPEPIPPEQVTVHRDGVAAIIQLSGVRPPDLDLINAARIEAYRELASGKLELLLTRNLDGGLASEPLALTDPDATDVVSYKLVVIDPIGRPSALTDIPV